MIKLDHAIFKKSSKLIDLLQRLFWVFFLSKISIFCFLFFKTDGVDRSRVADIKSGVFLASEKILAILDTPQGLHGKNPHP